MWGGGSVEATQTGYAAFLARTVGIPASNLPVSFDGMATVAGSVLTVVSVISGAVTVPPSGIPGPTMSDTGGVIPPNAAVTAQIDGTPGGIGDYLLNIPSLTGSVTPIEVTALNLQITATFQIACGTVDGQLCFAGDFGLATYNLGADRLINFAQDVPDQTYFQDLRRSLRINDISVGVPSAVNDQGTSVGILNPEFMKTLTMGDLQMMKTPYGRAYISLAQAVSTIWGLS